MTACIAECKCSLTVSEAPQRFCQPQLNQFLANIFQSIPHAIQLLKLPKVVHKDGSTVLHTVLYRLQRCFLQVRLNRFDLFHAHLFCTRGTRELGILFHSKEYPSYNKALFPINLGFCQQKSTLEFDENSMDFRNMLWFQASSQVAVC